MGLGKLFTKGASKVLSKTDKAKLAKEAAKARKLKENQKKNINKLEGMTSAEKKAAGIGEESPSRVMMGQAAKTRSGLISEYKRTLKQVESNNNLTDEQLDRMMTKLDDMRTKLKDAGVDTSQFNRGGQATKKAIGSTDYRMNKGGLLLSSLDNRKKR